MFSSLLLLLFGGGIATMAAFVGTGTGVYDELRRYKVQILKDVANRHQYLYDGGDDNIRDGRNDMYDGGNHVSFGVGEVEETDVVYNRVFRTDRYTFATYAFDPFIALMYIDAPDPPEQGYYIRVEGNLGADGGGGVTTGEGEVEKNGTVLKYKSFQVSGARDSTICEIYFGVAGALGASAHFTLTLESLKTSSGEYNTRELNNKAILGNASQNVVLGYMLLSRRDDEVIPADQVHAAMDVVATIAAGLPIEEMLEEHFSNLLAVLYEADENLYYYMYDGSEGNEGTDILGAPANGDMYDTGNRVSFKADEFSESNVEYGRRYDTSDYSFVTMPTHPFTAMFQVFNNARAINQFEIQVVGNLGADGDGDSSMYEGALEYNGFGVRYATQQAYGARGDKSVIEVYFTVSSEAWASEEGSFDFAVEGRGTRTFDNTLTVSGSPRNILIFYMLFSKEDNSDIPEAELVLYLQKILDIIDGIGRGRFLELVVVPTTTAATTAAATDATITTTPGTVTSTASTEPATSMPVTTTNPITGTPPTDPPNITVPLPENATFVDVLLHRACSGFGDMTSLIRDGYNYKYDGGRTRASVPYRSIYGYNHAYISDGGMDMYDRGNKVSFYTSSDEGKTSTVYGRLYKTEGMDFSSKPHHPYIAAMWIRNEERSVEEYSIQVTGNAGADGNGHLVMFSGSSEVSGFSVQFQVVQVYGAYDPTICEVYFTVANAEEWGSQMGELVLDIRSDNTDDLDHVATVTGSPKNVSFFYVLLSHYYGRLIEPEEVVDVLNVFVSAITERDLSFSFGHIPVLPVPRSIYAYVGRITRVCDNTRYDDHALEKCPVGKVASISYLKKKVSTSLGYEVDVEVDLMECADHDTCNATCERLSPDGMANCTTRCASCNYCNYPSTYYSYHYPYWMRRNFTGYLVPEEDLPTTPVEILPNCMLREFLPRLLEACIRPLQEDWPYTDSDICRDRVAQTVNCVLRELDTCKSDDIFNLAMTYFTGNATEISERILSSGQLQSYLCDDGPPIASLSYHFDHFHLEFLGVHSLHLPALSEHCDMFFLPSLYDWFKILADTFATATNRTELCKAAKLCVNNIIDAVENRCNIATYIESFGCDSVMRNQIRAVFAQSTDILNSFVPAMCEGIEPTPPPEEEVKDVPFLPKCTLPQAATAVWSCESILSEKSPHLDSGVCRANVKRLMHCIANRLLKCSEGEGFNIFSSLPEGESLFWDFINTVRNPEYYGDRFTYANFERFFCDNMYAPYMGISPPASGVVKAVCDSHTWTDFVYQLRRLYFDLAGARNSADVCVAFNDLRDWVVDTLKKRCNHLQLLKYLTPSDEEMGSYIVKLAKTAVKMVPELKLSICPDSLVSYGTAGFNETEWLKMYIKWRSETLPKWFESFQLWSTEMSEIKSVELREPPACLDLMRLKCRSSSQRCETDMRRCVFCYCPYHDYVDLSDFAFDPWLMDFENWQAYFGQYGVEFEAWLTA